MGDDSEPPARAGGRNHDGPMLTEAQERALLARVNCHDDRDIDAINQLWLHHVPLVRAIAAGYRRGAVSQDDLINAGHLGLHAAITRFDPTRYSTRLSAYAKVWIRGYIHDYLRRNTGPVRLPESKAHRQLAQNAARLIAEARASCQREGLDPSDAALHERIGRRVGLTSAETARGLRLLMSPGLSLDTGSEWSEHLKDDTVPDADTMIERLDHDRLRRRILSLIDEVLGERERIVFRGRAMTGSDPARPLEQLATVLGVSTARVHQIEASARRKIATALASRGFGEFATGASTAHTLVALPHQGPKAKGPVKAARREPWTCSIAAD